MAIRISNRKGKSSDARVSGFVCPNCKHWNTLGAYWVAHQHVRLEGPCQNPKCNTQFTIFGTDIKVK